ncbi:MAG: transposase [Clostridia bacterium]|nr:transposase [Clostridia bacterium]
MHFNDILSSVHNLVDSLDEKKKDFLKSPEKDFSRKRKISFSDCISLCLLMGSKTLFGELLDYYAKKGDMPSQSAMIQQRAKINVQAFEELFHMSSSLSSERLYNGYRLLAVDGSDLHIPTNPDDHSTFFPGANGQRPYNMMHLNAMYDILGDTYLDAVVQDRKQINESAAAVDMVDRSEITSAIVTADRGYESYNFMAHILEKGWEFLIRVKDIGGNGIVSRLDLPDSEEFDISIDLNITRKQSREVQKLIKDHPNEYRFAPPNSPFDYLGPTRYREPAGFYRLPFRVVRFRISDDTSEVILTSLPRE